MNDNIVLSVRDLEMNFYNNERYNKVLRGVSFQLQKGKIMCIVGKSGCGKSVTANSIMGPLPGFSRIEKGEIHLSHNGRDIRIDQLKRKGREMCQIRGDEVSMIFQDPTTAPNPISTVGYQINESLLYHDRAKTKSEVEQEAVRLSGDMGIPLLEKRVDEYSYQFSGDMCRRAMITMAMNCQPKVLTTDEPTTALDATIQTQMSELMQDLKNNDDAAILLITHDIGVMAELADNVTAMCMGNIMESGDAKVVLTRSAYPYARTLLESIPVLGKGEEQGLGPIEGSTPDPYNHPKGCQFAPRCEYATEQCMQEMPPETEVGSGYFCRCFHDLMGKEGQPDAGN